MIEAPWTDHQVENLNRWQRCDHVHPFTCVNHHQGSRVLIAQNDGWHCPTCEYRQTWAHAGMVLKPPGPTDIMELFRGKHP
jgi:hypothetical protein